MTIMTFYHVQCIFFTKTKSTANQKQLFERNRLEAIGTKFSLLLYNQYTGSTRNNSNSLHVDHRMHII